MWKKLLKKYRAYLIVSAILIAAAGFVFIFNNREPGAGKNSGVSEIMFPLQKITGRLGNAAFYQFFCWLNGQLRQLIPG